MILRFPKKPTKDEAIIESKNMLDEIKQLYLNKQVMNEDQLESLIRHLVELTDRIGGSDAVWEVFKVDER